VPAPADGGPAADLAGAPLPSTPFGLSRDASALLRQYWRAGYVDGAVERLQRAIDLDPAYAPAYAGLAEAYLRRHDTEKDPIWVERARPQAERALELDPSLSRARVALGRVLLVAGDAAGAEAAFREVLVRDPSNAAARRFLGDLRAGAGDPEGAEELYRQAITHGPDDPELLSVLGTAQFRAARYEEAAASFARAQEVAPEFVFAYRNRAAALHMLGRYPEAAAQLQRAIELRPDAPSYSNLGTLYFFQGLYPQAREAFERAIELGANDSRIWSNLGDAYRWSPGRGDDARRAYRRALQLLDQELGAGPPGPSQGSRRALLLAKGGDRERARAALATIDETGGDPTTLYRSALAYELIGRRGDALRSLAAALEKGYSVVEIRQDPELTALREDPAYHLMMVDHAEALPPGERE
jgi:serine/threonine-protein kinase